MKSRPVAQPLAAGGVVGAIGAKRFREQLDCETA
jgi:hypothetical protein